MDPKSAQPQSKPANSIEDGHIPVLGSEILELLAPQAGESVLDCTLGRGGHACMLLPEILPNGQYIGLDVDPENLEFARQRIKNAGFDATLHHSNFLNAENYIPGGGVNCLLADLGFASNQVDQAERGLGYRQDGPLDMRLDTRLDRTAADLVNELDERDLAEIIFKYGEERLSRRIARNIVELRRKTPIKTTSALTDICLKAYGPSGRKQRIHPATRTFQALRIVVNDELGVLEALMESLPKLMARSGRAAIISFHSLEDRIVKHAFRQYARDGIAEIITRKPVIANETEQLQNFRSRSAKLRVIRF